MEEEATVMEAREQLVSLLEQRTVPSQCRCTCLHSGGESGSFKRWGAVQCSTACGPTAKESLGSKPVSKECMNGSAEGQKSGGTKVPAAAKRRASSGDKTRVYPVMSRSAPSLSSQDLYNLRGTEVCFLQPHEQALYYRQRVTYDAARKGDTVHTHLPPRKKREAEPIAPQVATKGPGLQITPVHKPSGRSLDPRGIASADSLLLLQSRSVGKGAKQCTSGSKDSRGGTKKKTEQDSRVRWAHSLKLYQHNQSVVDGELSKDRRSPKRSALLQGRMKNQFTHHRLKMLQYQPDLKASRRGSGWLEGDEEVCSMPSLLDTPCGSESLLTNPLKCFHLGPSATGKDQKEESASKKPPYQQKEKKKNSKGKGLSRPVVPPLGHYVHGVVYNQQQPANLLQHRCQVSFMGMQKGFRYETLCLQGYGRKSPPLMVVGPWITATR